MKNVFKNALLGLSLCTGCLMEAAGGIDVKVIDNQTLKVELDKGNLGDVLQMKDRYGKILFQDSVGEMVNYQKTFYLELVPNGFYYLNLDKESSMLVTEVKKTENSLEISSSPRFFFKPCFKISDKQVKFFLSNPKNMDAEVRVLDSNEVLVGNFHSRDLIVKKTLDFTQIKSGTYSLEVKIDGQKFIRNMKVI